MLQAEQNLRDLENVRDQKMQKAVHPEKTWVKWVAYHTLVFHSQV